MTYKLELEHEEILNKMDLIKCIMRLQTENIQCFIETSDDTEIIVIREYTNAESEE